MALKDYKLPTKSDERLGLMGCYCSRHSKFYYPWTFFTRRFNTAEEGEKSNTRFICLEYRMMWFVQWLVYLCVSTVAVLINGFLSNVFQKLSVQTK